MNLNELCTNNLVHTTTKLTENQVETWEIVYIIFLK